MQRVLVVDDDPVVREVVSTYLRQAGLVVGEAADGLAALEAFDADPADVVVLDLMLPGIDGFEVFRRLRTRSGQLPVLMLTAKGTEDERVLGLQVGADDYVTKPFSARELALRVQALLRRVTDGAASTSAAPKPPAPVLRDGDLVCDVNARRVHLRDQELALTVREFDLLACLMASPGVAWSRTDLMNTVWGWDYGDESTVTVHVRRLRSKVEDDPSNPTRLVTVWGTGYRWENRGA